MEDEELLKILFAELIEELGGVVELDANKVLTDIKQGRFKRIGIAIKENIVYLEVFDEDENKEAE